MPDDAFVRSTQLYRQLAAKHPKVEVWPDEGFTEGGWNYFWIVTNSEGAVRNLAYVRSKQGRLQVRGYDENGDDLWTDGY